MTSRRGYTLIETLLALGVMSVLAGALGSVLLIAVRAIPSAQTARGSASPTASAGGALDLIASELRYATAVTKGTTTQIEFTTPDRDGDGTPEALAYAWSGVAGDPLTRRVNGGAATTFVPNLETLALTYTWRTLATTTLGTLSTGSSTNLSAYDHASPTPYSVGPAVGVGMTLKPTMPAGALSYSISKVSIKLRRGSTSGGPAFDVVVYGVNAQGTPTSTILASKTNIDAGSLANSLEWYEADLVVAGMPAGSAFAVAVMYRSGTEPCRAGTFTSGSMSPGEGLLTTANAGASWTLSSTSALCVKIEGRITTRDRTTSTVRTLERVDLHVQTRDAGSQAVDVSALTRNRPVLP